MEMPHGAGCRATLCHKAAVRDVVLSREEKTMGSLSFLQSWFLGALLE